MRPTVSRHLLLAFAAAPLALGLAACKDKDSAAAPTGEPVAKVAPPAGQKWEETVVATPEGGMKLGNPAAPLRLVEYGSLSCPHCARFAQEGMQPLINEYVASGRVSYEFRSFAIHQAFDIPLTTLVRCGPKERFFPMVEAIYTNFEPMNQYIQQPEVQQAANAATKLAPAQRLVALADALGYTQFFASRGLSNDQAHACLSNMETVKQIGEYSNKYSADGVTGTPTFKLNGALIDLPQGSEPWDIVQRALKAAGAR